MPKSHHPHELQHPKRQSLRSMPIPTALAALVLLLFLLPSQASADSTTYDPLHLPAIEIEEFDLKVEDPDRNREIPLCLHLPADAQAAPVVLFSHGLGGSCRGNDYLAHHWAARGYAAIFVQHPGSDETVWKDVPRRQRLEALKQAANAQNFILRAGDIPAVIDQLEAWTKQEGNRLFGKLDLARIGMSGHSFGARTTQVVSGEVVGRGGSQLSEPRIKAALALSPNAPPFGSPMQAYGSVETPWMLVTGTHDVSRIGSATVESRLAVFPALPPGGKYELVLDGAQHSAFSDRSLSPRDGERNPNHHRALQALSTAFWDAYLLSDPAALAWLDGEGPRTVLEPKDRWQTK